MAEPFLAEIRIVGFNFAPRGWTQCDGQLLPINQNQALFSLMGTTYGGDGRTTFGLPDLRGRAPIHSGGNSAGPGLPPTQLGAKEGTETVTLTSAQLPSHTHLLPQAVTAANTAGSQTSPVNHVPAVSKSPLYANRLPVGVGNTGGGQPHNNMQPYQVVNFCIALQGLFPSRN